KARPDGQDGLAEAVAALARRMGPANAAAACAKAARLALAAAPNAYPYGPAALARAVAAPVMNVGPEENRRRADALAAAAGGQAALSAPLTGLAPLAEAARPLPGRTDPGGRVEWSGLIREAGLVIRDLREPRPGADLVAEHPELDDCFRMPFFLIFELMKPAP